jgi:hypothetical protein
MVQIAAECGLSARYFARAFKTSTAIRRIDGLSCAAWNGPTAFSRR